MARSSIYWYNVIVAEKQSQESLNSLQPDIDSSQQLLADLTSESKVADWRLYYYVIAVVMNLFDQVFDLFKSETTSIIQNNAYGNKWWWTTQALLFQYGDDLILKDAVPVYENVDPTKRIVKYAATLPGKKIQIKVAKEGSSSKFEVLSSEELTAVQTYFNKIRPAGEKPVAQSFDPDNLKVTYDVYYDPLLMSSSGILLSDGSTKPVEDALRNHIESIEFNGELKLSALTDSVQAAVGVSDVVLLVAQAKFGLNDFADINRKYLPRSGWMVLEDADLTINYIANV